MSSRLWPSGSVSTLRAINNEAALNAAEQDYRHDKQRLENEIKNFEAEQPQSDTAELQARREKTQASD